MPRGRSRYATPGPRAGSVLLDTRGVRRRRRRRRRPYGGGGFGWDRLFRWLLVLLVLAAIGGAAWVWRSRENAIEARHDAVERFAAAWAKGDRAAMWSELTPESQRTTPQRRLATAYANADRAAGVKSVKVGRISEERDGKIAVPVVITTELFGPLRGTLQMPVSGTGDDAGIKWDFAMRLPGLRRDEAVVRRSGPEPRRASVLAADGSPLNATPGGAAIAGRSGENPTGLERVYDDRLGGHPSARLMFGDRLIARTKAVRGRPVRTTIRPGLVAAAENALGGKLGGVAVIRPRDGAVLATAGLGMSATQPPGSTFKIITTAAALDTGVATPDSTYPVQTAATLSGVQLRNAGGEACGGSLHVAFAESCNSVFAPLGAKVGARRLVRAAEAFGFNRKQRVPAAKESTIGPADQLKDDLAVGAAAIGQDRDLATPLAMAGVGATIANNGRFAEPRITTLQKIRRRRAVPAKVARQVESMMIEVVRGGTGTAGAVPGVTVAGKTGTAELVPNSSDPKDADAWFVAYPVENPRYAVAVMLVGAGFGGTAAAPVARRVLSAALDGA
jgi:penicillin-binding protein A